MQMLSDQNIDDEHAPNILVAGMYAAIGGTLPSLCRIAPTGLREDPLSIISLGHLVAILFYALLGFLLCVGLRERKFRQAFVLGVAAPGVITNLLAGLPAKESVQDPNLNVNVAFFSQAYASEGKKEIVLAGGFFDDLRYGLGFKVEKGEPKTTVDVFGGRRPGERPEPYLHYLLGDLRFALDFINDENREMLCDAGYARNVLGKVVHIRTMMSKADLETFFSERLNREFTSAIAGLNRLSELAEEQASQQVGCEESVMLYSRATVDLADSFGRF